MGMARGSEGFFVDLLANAGVRVNGDGPDDILVHDRRLYDRVLSQGTLGLGEAYMDRWWDAPHIDKFLTRVLEFNVRDAVRFDWATAFSLLRSRLLNLQRLRTHEVGEKHYDTGNDLFAAMLDPRMVYSCGYWAEADGLAAAQEAKLDLICRKIGLQPGMRVLDIGSGWGGFLMFAAERYGITGLGVTVSKEQAAYANQLASARGLPVETRLQDYLSLEGRFDRIVSVGMFEHVGVKNYRRYFDTARSLLAPDGLFLLHTIGGNLSVSHGDPWAEKYIFPNGMLPSAANLTAALETRFVIEDWHNFGADYDRTLLAWHANFEAAWPALQNRYDERFHRMWRYYLLSFAAMFRARQIQLWQLVLSPEGLRGGYRSVR